MVFGVWKHTVQELSGGPGKISAAITLQEGAHCRHEPFA